MQPIVIYFNEQSLLGSLNSYQWKAGISGLCKMLDDFFQLRRDGNIAFLDGQLEEQCGGASIRTQIKEEYGQSRTGYQRFLSKVKKLHSTVLPPLHQMHEMHWNGRRAHGLVLADWQRSWVFSIEPSHKDWSQPGIPATRHGLDEVSAELLVTECQIQNLANTAHCTHWETNIRDWGATVAPSCVLDSINGHHIVMYPGPREHNPPHVHVLHKGSNDTLAKYRIEDCALEDGKPTLNSEMRTWLTQYRDQLLISWERCQRGGTPYRLELP